jgi:hypothetical protein
MKLHEEFKLYENMWEATEQEYNDALNEANLAQQFNGLFSFKGECPGCSTEFSSDKDCALHVLECDKAKELLSKRSAVIETKEAGHAFDCMTNISAWAFMKYVTEHDVCELCGAQLTTLDERRPDHRHLSNTSPVNGAGTGYFRGVLCNSCNLMLGTFEKKKLDIDKIAAYLNSAGTKISDFNNKV